MEGDPRRHRDAKVQRPKGRTQWRAGTGAYWIKGGRVEMGNATNVPMMVVTPHLEKRVCVKADGCRRRRYSFLVQRAERGGREDGEAGCKPSYQWAGENIMAQARLGGALRQEAVVSAETWN